MLATSLAGVRVTRNKRVGKTAYSFTQTNAKL